MEVMIADGVSVVVLTPESALFSADILQSTEEKDSGFYMPLYLTRIENSAFEEIDAACVKISENVVYIGYRAFANCKNLREFHISASVEKIESDALEGCTGVTVYGTTDTAQKFADAAGFDYVDQSVPYTDPDETLPLPLPLVRR